MPFELPALPYAMDALEPVLTQETLSYHYGKHHQTYVNNLNQLVQGTAYESASLEEIILSAEGPLFNNAAQIWNHTFYWNCLTPNSTQKPEGDLAQAITKTFGSFESFKEQFTKAAVGAFGSAWAWLVMDEHSQLKIITTSNAATPMTQGYQALLTCDVWEHAYYIDYRNRRADYVAKFWDIVNWAFVAKQFSA